MSTTFKDLTAGQMLHLLKVQGSKLKDAKSEADLERKTRGCEKGELLKIVKRYIDEDDIDVLLKQSKPTPRSYTEEEKPKLVKGQRKSKKGAEVVDANKLMQQAKFVRANLASAKKQSPQLAGMSNEEILKLCDEWESAARDPEKLDAINKMQSSMGTEDMKAMQQAAKEAQDKAKAEGKEASQMDIMLELRRKNPAQFRNFLKKQMPAAGNMEDSQLDTMLKSMESMSDDQLRTTMDMGQQFTGYYKMADEYTGGYGKWVIGVVAVILVIIVVYLIYLALTVSWYYGKILMGVGSASATSGAAGSDDTIPVFGGSGSGSGASKSSEFDEF